MNTVCPDWRSLCDRREAEQIEDAEWRRALEHLDDCPDCERDAVAIEPTLMFQRLPVLEVDADEIAAMRRAVAGMSRAESIERRRPAVSRTWLRAAAVAAVLLGPVLLRGSGPSPTEIGAVQSTATEAPSQSETDLSLEQMPLVEFIDPAYGSIIQVDDPDLSVVVVANFDV
ncbi:MAG: hypothetical protein GY719_24565 [bacterium]|nr:hypothetical protein [bacterium]